jgi:hypothetical protein
VVEEFEDGSFLLDSKVYIEPLVPDLQFAMNIFTGGVTFEDSTISKSLFTSDFSLEAGTNTAIHPYQMIMDKELTRGPCHTIRIYQDDVQVGGDL